MEQNQHFDEIFNYLATYNHPKALSIIYLLWWVSLNISFGFIVSSQDCRRRRLAHQQSWYNQRKIAKLKLNNHQLPSLLLRQYKNIVIIKKHNVFQDMYDNLIQSKYSCSLQTLVIPYNISSLKSMYIYTLYLWPLIAEVSLIFIWQNIYIYMPTHTPSFLSIHLERTDAISASPSTYRRFCDVCRICKQYAPTHTHTRIHASSTWYGVGVISITSIFLMVIYLSQSTNTQKNTISEWVREFVQQDLWCYMHIYIYMYMRVRRALKRHIPYRFWNSTFLYGGKCVMVRTHVEHFLLIS